MPMTNRQQHPQRSPKHLQVKPSKFAPLPIPSPLLQLSSRSAITTSTTIILLLMILTMMFLNPTTALNDQIPEREGDSWGFIQPNTQPISSSLFSSSSFPSSSSRNVIESGLEFGKISMATGQGSITGQIVRVKEAFRIKEFLLSWDYLLEVTMIEYELTDPLSGHWYTDFRIIVDQKGDTFRVDDQWLPPGSTSNYHHLLYFTITFTFSKESLRSFLLNEQSKSLPKVHLVFSNWDEKLFESEGKWPIISRWFHEIDNTAAIYGRGTPSTATIPIVTLTPIPEFPYYVPPDSKLISLPPAGQEEVDFIIPRQFFNFHLFQRTFRFPIEMFSINRNNINININNDDNNNNHNHDLNHNNSQQDPPSYGKLDQVILTATLRGPYFFFTRPDLVPFHLNNLNNDAINQYPKYSQTRYAIKRDNYTEDMIKLMEGESPFCMVNSIFPVPVTIQPQNETQTFQIQLPPSIFSQNFEVDQDQLQSYTMSCYNFVIGLNFYHPFSYSSDWSRMAFNYTMVVDTDYSIITNHGDQYHHIDDRKTIGDIITPSRFLTQSSFDSGDSESSPSPLQIQGMGSKRHKFSTTSRILFPIAIAQQKKANSQPSSPTLNHANCVTYDTDLANVIVQCVVSHDKLIKVDSKPIFIMRPGDLEQFIPATLTRNDQFAMFLTQLQPLPSSDSTTKPTYRLTIPALEARRGSFRLIDPDALGSAAFQVATSAQSSSSSYFDPAQPILLTMIAQRFSLENRFIKQRLEIGVGLEAPTSEFSDPFQLYSFNWFRPTALIPASTFHSVLPSDQRFRLATTINTQLAIQRFKIEFETIPPGRRVTPDGLEVEPPMIELLERKFWDPSRSSRWEMLAAKGDIPPCSYTISNPSTHEELTYPIMVSSISFYRYVDDVFVDITNLVRVFPTRNENDPDGPFSFDVFSIKQIIQYPPTDYFFTTMKSTLTCSSIFLRPYVCDSDNIPPPTTPVKLLSFVAILSNYRVQLNYAIGPQGLSNTTTTLYNTTTTTVNQSKYYDMDTGSPQVPIHNTTSVDMNEVTLASGEYVCPADITPPKPAPTPESQARKRILAVIIFASTAGGLFIIAVLSIIFCGIFRCGGWNRIKGIFSRPNFDAHAVNQAYEFRRMDYKFRLKRFGKDDIINSKVIESSEQKSSHNPLIQPTSISHQSLPQDETFVGLMNRWERRDGGDGIKNKNTTRDFTKPKQTLYNTKGW